MDESKVLQVAFMVYAKSLSLVTEKVYGRLIVVRFLVRCLVLLVDLYVAVREGAALCIVQLLYCDSVVSYVPQIMPWLLLMLSQMFLAAS